MLVSALKTVLVMSCASTSVGLVLLLIRYISAKLFSFRFRAKIWYIVLIISLIPISVSITQSNVPPEYQALEYSKFFVSDTKPLTQVITMAETTQSGNGNLWWEVFAFLWIAVAAVLFARHIFSYILFIETATANSEFTQKYKNINVRSTMLLSAPLTVGLFRKTILIPESVVDYDEKQHILMHEYTHIRHGDIFMKWMCMVMKCVHWFNPVMRFICTAIEDDSEIACDYYSTNAMSPDEKKQYMNTILSLISKSASSHSLTTQMASSKKCLEKRFAAISSSVKQSKLKRCASFALMLTLMSAIAIASGVVCERVYGDSIPSITLNILPQKNIQVLDVKTPDTEEVKTDNGNQSVSDQKTPLHDYELQNAVTTANRPPKTDRYESQNTNSPDATNSVQDVGIAHEAPDEPMDIPNIENSHINISNSADAPKAEDKEGFYSTSKNADGFENEDDEPSYYPYSGQVKFDGLTMAALRTDIEQSGQTSTKGDNANFSTSYVSDTLSYKNGSKNELKNVTSDENGKITFYMNSDYDRHITVSFSEDGKQIAGYGMVPDNETIYVFGGFDPQKTYDITVSSETGDTWKVESDYIIY
ncbi:MAG: M56 family metallopeptidase [Ruminococcaceae bacterium]|nr:M56 family metallopeptidase [Oscillospiraceae bacterium]